MKRVRIEFLSLLAISAAISTPVLKPAHTQPVEEGTLEVVLEAFSEGFYRPNLSYVVSRDENLPVPEPAEIRTFDERMRFALDWPGYVRLVTSLDTTRYGPPELPAAGGPPTELRVSYGKKGRRVRVALDLAEPGEESFYSSAFKIDSDEIERNADEAAEEILFQLTGMRPPFRSRIVCVEKHPGNIKELILLAYDGGGRLQLTSDESIALSPSWSPDGRKIVFCSFRGGEDADLYIADLEKKKISALLRRAGTDAAPSWSPKGDYIVFAASQGRRTDLYLIRPNGKGLRNLTASYSIETSPSWSPTGGHVVFMSDRSGSPQIYRMDRDGANLLRLTYDGAYNADPSWSPAGDRIAYARLESNGFQVRIMDPTGDYDIPLTDERGDHLEPSWSPDGMKISYSYRGKVWVMNADGTGRRPLLADGLMPDWSPIPE